MEEKTSSPAETRTAEKRVLILKACHERSISALRELAVSSGGFLNDELRQQTWPIILGLPLDKTAESPEKLYGETPQHTLDVPWQSLPQHRDEEQVQLDVNRAFVYYPHDQSPDQIITNKKALSDLIVQVLRQHPYLCYFQGYHDICQVFLLTLPHALRAPCVAHLSVLRIRDFMLPTLYPAISQLRLIPDILRAADERLCEHLSSTEPFFALSGMLTMYAHDIQSLDEIARLFDVLLVREPVFGVYMFAQIILKRKRELLEIPADEPDMLHSVLSKLPQPLDLEALIEGTARLVEEYPPESLPAWKQISKYSALKTGQDVQTAVGQDLYAGRMAFEAQVKEMERAEYQKELWESMLKYKGPATAVGIAVLVGLGAIMLRRSGLAFAWPSLR